MRFIFFFTILFVIFIGDSSYSDRRENQGLSIREITDYLQAIKEDPYDALNINNFIIAMIDNAPGYALDAMLEIYQSNQDSTQLITSIGLLYSKIGDFEKAKIFFTLAYSLEPNNLFYINNLAVVFDSIGEFKKAAMLYDKLINMLAVEDDINISQNFSVDEVGNRLIYIIKHYL